jgi:peptidoglycan hydrolase-like protein with peptidoglycan-binding domain
MMKATQRFAQRSGYSMLLRYVLWKEAGNARIHTREYEFINGSTRSIMKRLLLSLLFISCAISFAHADDTIRSLQQTLKDQGFYYGAVTGDKSAETTSAIRRYQIRKGLHVTGELNEETLRSVRSNSDSIATAPRPTPKPVAQADVAQVNKVRVDADAGPDESSPVSSFSQPDHPLQSSPSYSASFYQSAPIRMNHRIIAGVQYQLMARGYYRGRVDGKYGRDTAFALQAFQSSAGLPTTGRLDTGTLEALGSSDVNFAYSAPRSPGYETWMPVRKFKDGKWKLKWKRYHRPFGSGDADEDRQADTSSPWNPYNDNY